ncbi:izumo sperm-egg fusion protein 4 [Hemicordylus capensis]|uniref:izumo sperm-egg fusion protein 4 n=1 Tax=Hemicordylus capensis TaxID=884348 RepID=UPI002302F291|nr:izumo sperm-egg fusion protein 4 [Hemicordylus capensis]
MGFSGQFRPGQFLVLVVVLSLGPGPTRSCLQCDPNFTARFASYAPRLSRKSWGLGDVPATGRQLRGWTNDTLEELQLGVPAEIPMENLTTIASKVYEKLEVLFKGKTYKQGVLPDLLHSIFQEQVSMLRNAIIESRVKCQWHCGISQYDAVSCVTCTSVKPTCFGYNCESSEQWESALKGLYAYIKKLHKEPGKEWSAMLKQIPGFSHCTSKSVDNLNFTSIENTLSKNWLNVMALKELEGDLPLMQLLAPSC